MISYPEMVFRIAPATTITDKGGCDFQGHVVFRTSRVVFRCLLKNEPTPKVDDSVTTLRRRVEILKALAEAHAAANPPSQAAPAVAEKLRQAAKIQQDLLMKLRLEDESNVKKERGVGSFFTLDSSHTTA